MAFLLVTGVASAGAQIPDAQQLPPAAVAPPPPPQPTSPTQARYNMSILEAVFETAVQRGAQLLREEVQNVMPPDMILLTGAPRARGFRLEGYGYFFDVDVPGISQTVAWTMTRRGQDDAVARAALQQLRSMLSNVSDRRQREDLDWFLRMVALQMGVPEATATQTADRGATAAVDRGSMPQPGVVQSNSAGALPPQAPATPSSRPSFLDDPAGAYEAAVKKALIDAMLDYSGPLEIGAEEWLIVAARDNEDRHVSPSSPFDVATIQMSIRGSDLLGFRAGRLTREEAHQRVQIREF